MSLTSKQEFINIGRGESFIKNFYFSVLEADQESKIYISLAIKNKQASAEIMCETLFESSKEVFFNHEFSDDYERFEATLKEINRIFEKYQRDSISGNIGNINMIVGAVIGNVLHLSQTGEGEAYLVRSKHLSVISEGLSEGGKPNFFSNIASGEIENEDIIIFCSTRLLRYITKNDLSKIFSANSNTDQEIAKLKSLLEVETLDQMAINIVKIIEGIEEAPATIKKFEIKELINNFKNHPFLKKFTDREKTNLSEKQELQNLEKEQSVIEENLLNDIEQIEEISHKIEKNKGKSLKWRFNTHLVKQKLQNLLKIFEKNENDEIARKKQVLAALAGVIIVLLISIVFLKINGDKQKLLDGYETTLSEVQEDIEKAYTIGITDKQKATEMLTQSEEKIKEILASGYLRGLATQRLDSIQEIKEKLDGIRSINDPKVLADLGEVKSDSNAIGLVALENNLAAYEPSAIHEIVLSKIESENNLPNNEELIDGNYFADQDTIVFLTKSNKIVEYKEGRFQFMDTQDTTWKSGIDVKSFGSKIYLLDSAGNQIWRYTRLRESYSSSDPSFGENVDLSKAVDMAIDGSIYILNQDGSIQRFYGGEEQELIVRKAPLTPLKEPTAIYTDAEAANLYILEPSEKRVLIYSKEPRTGNLSYSYQIKFPTLNSIQDMLVDFKNGKVYILADEKVYEEKL